MFRCSSARDIFVNNEIGDLDGSENSSVLRLAAVRFQLGMGVVLATLTGVAPWLAVSDRTDRALSGSQVTVSLAK